MLFCSTMHLNVILFYVTSFFRQFFRSVRKADYLTMRHGFISSHLAPGSKFDFQIYIKRSMEDDFKVVVRITPILWASSVVKRDELLESGISDTLNEPTDLDQRSRLLMSTERLNKASEIIEQGRRIMSETEDLGVALLQDLHRQRQSLLHANEILHGVIDSVSRARRTLNSISRRMHRNKWIIVSVAAVLIFAVLVILYFKLTH